jgi:capsular polysaccharide biosynthesis protein
MIKSFINKIIFSNQPPYVENILEWALHRNWFAKIIHEPFIVNVPIPQGNMPENVIRRYEASSKTGFGPQYLYCLPKAKAYGAGFISIPEGGFLLESSWRPQYLLESNIYKARFRRHKIRLDGDYMSIDSFFSRNHGHWLYDEIPRIYNALSHLPKKTKFLIHTNPQQWKLDSLRAIGIDKERLLEFPAYTEVECENLWFASKLGDSEKCITSPRVAQSCSELFRELAEKNAISLKETPITRQRVFVSRSNFKKKRIKNEESLWPILKKYGFEIINPEEYSLMTQAEYFKNCEILMGSFGAALTNLIFCKPDATLIDLQEDGFNCPRCWYWKLAAVHNKKYITMVGKRTESTGWGDTSYYIDSEKFNNALDQILNINQSNKNEWFKLS